jgi:hypothetical protein
MSDVDDRATVLLSRSWKLPESELSFVTRALAGAVSRTTPVIVLVPSPFGPAEPDGAFDLIGTGLGPEGGWPPAPRAQWPDGLSRDGTFIVDEADHDVLSLLDHHAPGCTVYTVAPTEGNAERRHLVPLRFTASAGSAADFIGLHVPINPIAATHRHNGLGFTGYVLVLSDRSAAPDVSPPSPMVAWLTARFPDLHIVVVEDATAAVWRGRVLRGIVSVYTRTDLWRLLAHARVTIDLAPGRIIARECVESLRFGTPILVPTASAASAHADAGGGLTFSGYAELLAGVAHLSDDAVRDAMSAQGRRYADAQYGDQTAFVQRVARALAAPGPSAR